MTGFSTGLLPLSANGLPFVFSKGSTLRVYFALSTPAGSAGGSTITCSFLAWPGGSDAPSDTSVPGIGAALGSGGVQGGRRTTSVAFHVCWLVFVTVTSKPDLSWVAADGV